MMEISIIRIYLGTVEQFILSLLPCDNKGVAELCLMIKISAKYV